MRPAGLDAVARCKVEIAGEPGKGTTVTVTLPGDRVLLIDQDRRAA